MRQGGFWVLVLSVALACASPGVALADYQPELRFGGTMVNPSTQEAGGFQTPVVIDGGRQRGTSTLVMRPIGASTSSRPRGIFIQAWGWDVVPGGATTFEKCTAVAPGCKAGSNGAGTGQFASVDGIAQFPNRESW